MDQFVSTFPKKIDAKGRVSIPASFRAILTREGSEALYCYPGLDVEAIDAGGLKFAFEIRGLIDALDPYSDERDYLETVLFGISEILNIDADGRLILTDTLRAAAHITDQLVFVGMGNKFRIWEPARFAAHMQLSREQVRTARKLLRAKTATSDRGDSR